jgi:YVTN family beta-propeller protein
LTLDEALRASFARLKGILPEAKSSIIFNIRLSDDGLRGEQGRFNTFHIAPSNSMRADALAQYLIWKKWPRWYLLKGTAPSDADYVAAVERAAGRFGGKIVGETSYKFDASNPPTDSGHQQIQTQMPEVTQALPSTTWCGSPTRSSISANTFPTESTTEGGTLYIANEDDSMVTVMDTKSGDVKAEIPVDVEPEGMGVSPDSKYTVATSESTSMAHVIDNATQKLVANVLVDTRPGEAKFTPDGKEVWVSSEVGGSISVIDASTWKVIKKVRFEVSALNRSSRSAWSSPRTARACSRRLGLPTASRSSIPRPMR